MRGASRESLAAGREGLESLLASGRSGGAGASQVAEDLFGVTGALAGSAGLRRALTDPSRDGEAKAALVARLFGAKVSGGVVDLVSGLVRGRWAAGGDLTDSVELLAVSAELASAEQAGRLEDGGVELFRIYPTHNPEQRRREAI